MKAPVAKWLLLTGCGNGLGIASLFFAFRTGDVVQVSPIVSSFPFFTLLVSVVFLREEVITRRTVLGLLLVVPSVAMVSLAR